MMAGYKAVQLRGVLRMVGKELPLALECVTNALLLSGAIATTVIWGLNPKAFLSAVRSSVWPETTH